MMKSIFLSFFLFLMVTSFAQDIKLYKGNHGGKFYEASLVKYTKPGFVLTENKINLPVVTDSAATIRGALRLQWLSAKSGSWEAKIAMPGWPGIDASEIDSLVFFFLVKNKIDAGFLPSVCFEDMNDTKFVKVPFPEFTITRWRNNWKRASISLAKFRHEKAKADITRLKSVIFMQSGCDSLQHTLFLQDISLISGRKKESQRNIVVLGSSTAAGIGTSCADSVWVNRLRGKLMSFDSSYRIINLAIGGYTTYRIMPSHFNTPAGKPKVSEVNNIDYALSFKPEMIIINLPTNDIGSGYSIHEQLINYDSLINTAKKNRIVTFLTTTQPRNFKDPLRRKLLRQMKDTLELKYKERVIDFWSALADSDGTIIKQYDSGDGVHLNDAGHRLLFDSVNQFLIRRQEPKLNPQSQFRPK